MKADSPSDEEKKSISRRNFLAGSGVTAALATGTLLWGCSPSQKKSTENGTITSWDEEADVVIVGGGGAGASAALTAAEAGASVIILEKGNATGGSTALCGQAIMGVGTSIQKELGIEDSVEEAMKYFTAIGDGREDLIRVVVENSADAVEWLIGLGMQVPATVGMPGLVYGGQEEQYANLTPPVMRTHYSVKPDPGLWPVLQKAIEAQSNIDIKTSTPATKLVQDSETGEILGVIAGKTSYRAKKGVVLAAGGFARNPDLFHALVSRHDVHTTANPEDTGDGLNMGWAAGAGAGYFGMLSTVDYIDPSIPCVFIVLGPDIMEGKPPFILVNTKGERFSNERKFYSYICEDLLKQPDARAFVVTCGKDGLAGMSKAGEHAAKGDTVEELATAMGVDSATLKNTIDNWNAQCASGVDTQFNRATELYPLDNGPFYAAEVKASNASTFGGLTVDSDMHVLRAIDSQPIPRLYAAGMNSITLGRFYPTCGSAVACAITTGRKAGSNVAKEEATK